MKRLLGLVALAVGLLAMPGTAAAAPGDQVGSVTFSQDCSSGIGVGIAYDGAGHLWVSCYQSSPDLLRASATTGVVDQTYTIEGGLGALAYDASRNAIWAGPGCGPSTAVWKIQLDGSKSVTGSAAAFDPGPGDCLDDGLAYDASNDTIYYSPDTSTTIAHFHTDGTAASPVFNWTGLACYNSGLAIGGSLLFQGSDGCSHVWVVDKTTLAPAFDFPTGAVRDEGLTCDTQTFAPTQVMWSKEAYNPNRAFAFEIPAKTCGVGGQPSEETISAAGTTISTDEGVPFSGSVATFTDTAAGTTAGDYTATIDWGDGTTSAGVITGGSGSFDVAGTHTYAEEAAGLTVRVTITETAHPVNTAAANSTANVGDAAIAATCTAAASSLPAFNGSVASFSHADAAEPASDFTATIDWGDGTTAAGTVTGSGGAFDVSGSHLYGASGIYDLNVTITDNGGATATARCRLLVAVDFAPGGGSFVIGDLYNTGSPVTFWAAKWSLRNHLSGGLAPASFKGFAASPTQPSCGVSWRTRPGNSPPPPAGPLPEYMAVIVADAVHKSGATITGTTAHIVIVHTNPGYMRSPGHPGTGTIVATIC